MRAGHYAGLAEEAKHLLSRGVSPNERDANGWTPLMYAAYGGHLRLVKVLLDAGADPLANYLGFDSVYWAVHAGHEEVSLTRHWAICGSMNGSSILRK